MSENNPEKKSSEAGSNPHPFPVPCSLIPGIFVSGIQPEMTATAPFSAISSFACSNSIRSRSAGYFARIAFSSDIAIFAVSTPMRFSTRASFSCIFESRISGSLAGKSSLRSMPRSRSMLPSIRSTSLNVDNFGNGTGFCKRQFRMFVALRSIPESSA